jgi:hypothetical protein
VGYNASIFKEQVNNTMDFLSDTILYLQLVTIEDLRNGADKKQLEDFYFAGIKLSAAIVECLTIAIKLVTGNFESNQVYSVTLLINRIEECRLGSC